MVCYYHYFYGNTVCINKAIPIRVLMEQTRQVLNLIPEEELTSELIRERIKQIRLDDKKLIYTFIDGRTITKEWSLISRRKSWTSEMKEKARQKTLAYYQTKREVA